MIPEVNWFERKFSLDSPVEMFPYLVERLRGTPARLEERIRSLPIEILTRQEGDEWSIQENVGHLWDLEALWAGRIDDYLANKETLQPTDVQNQKTHQANHNANTIHALLGTFRAERERLVVQLDQFDEADAARSALHPRLQQPMRVIDLIYFAAEHDDDHLAQITALINKFR